MNVCVWVWGLGVTGFVGFGVQWYWGLVVCFLIDDSGFGLQQVKEQNRPRVQVFAGEILYHP